MALLAVLSVVAANLLGREGTFSLALLITEENAEVSMPSYSHGWPLVFLERDALFSKAMARPSSRFPFDDAIVISFKPLALLLDAMLALIIAASVHNVARRSSKRCSCQFSIRSLVMVVTLAAVLLSIWKARLIGDIGIFVFPVSVGLLCVATTIWFHIRQYCQRR
jgi:hypothetical protein